MENALVPIIGFAAYSGTGKTTLLTKLIPLLGRTGLRIGIVKHSHHDFEIDRPGKDSYKLRLAGAESVLLVSAYRRAIINEFKEPVEPRLNEQLSAIDQSLLDLILVEGFRHEKFPKIELHRPILGKPLLYPNDQSIIAVATDRPLSLPAHLPRLDLNDVEQIGNFIIQRFLDHDL